MRKIIVIGAGAAGLMAADTAAKQGHKVLLLEKNEKAGKKIYITGKGRCNLTNDCETQDFFRNVTRNPKFLYSAIYGFDQTAVKSYFEEHGCEVKVERGARVFPVSDHASDVTKALTDSLKKHHVQTHYRTTVTKLLTKNTQEGQVVTGVSCADGTTYDADAVIVCTGGVSYPSTGSTGDGYTFAKTLGLNVTNTYPSLVPFTVKEAWPLSLQGLALKNVSVTIKGIPAEDENAKDDKIASTEKPAKKKKKEKPVYTGFGELLFTHFGISGPLILSASSYCKVEDYPKGFLLQLDLKPALTAEQLFDRMKEEFTISPMKSFGTAIRTLFPQRLSEVMGELSGIDVTRRVSSISDTELMTFLQGIKAVPITITGTRGFPEAIITRGGVDVKEINPSTMESRKVKGLYFAGEVLDVDALTGGFNLQIAWSTGHLAGESVSEEN